MTQIRTACQVSDSAEGEGALVQRIAENDQQAMRIVFDAHFDSVFRICHKICGQTADAQEVSETVFVELWNFPDRFNPQRGSLRTYLGLLARSRSRDHVRSTINRGKRRELAAAELTARVAEKQPQEPCDVVSRDEQRRLVHRVLRSLPEEFRTVLTLAFFEAKSHREIASILEVPLGTVKSRARRGLLRFRERLRDGNRKEG